MPVTQRYIAYGVLSILGGLLGGSTCGVIVGVFGGGDLASYASALVGATLFPTGVLFYVLRKQTVPAR